MFPVVICMQVDSYQTEEQAGCVTKKSRLLLATSAEILLVNNVKARSVLK